MIVKDKPHLRVKSWGPKVESSKAVSRPGLSKVPGGPKATSLLNIFMHSQQGASQIDFLKLSTQYIWFLRNIRI